MSTRSNTPGDPPGDALSWTLARLEKLTALDAFALFRLRQQVFVMEQDCLYPDIDGIDLEAWHLLGSDAAGILCAYLRIIPPLGRFPGQAIGRVVTDPSARRGGYGRALMREGIGRTRTLFPGGTIHISAQTYLHDFYTSLGFEPVSGAYMEDGIEHVDMVLRTAN